MKCREYRKHRKCRYKECRESRYIGVVGTRAGNHTGKCRVCRYMMVGTVPLVQESHPHRDLSPHKECKECRYMGVVMGTYTWHHARKCRQCRDMVVDSVPLVEKVTHARNARNVGTWEWWGHMQGSMEGMRENGRNVGTSWWGLCLSGKSHPCRKCRECRYMGVLGTHTGKCRECRYMVVGTVPLSAKISSTQGVAVRAFALEYILGCLNRIDLLPMFKVTENFTFSAAELF